MKIKILSIAFISVVLSLFVGCDEDDTVIIDQNRRDVTLAEFLSTSPSFEAFFNAAEVSAIPFELAQKFGISPVSEDPSNGLAVREFGENGQPNSFYSVLDLLDVENAQFTVFVPRLDDLGGRVTTFDIGDLNGFLSNEDDAARRAEIGNVLLYHMLDRRIQISELVPETSIVPLSSGGNDEIFITIDVDDITEEETLQIGGLEFNEGFVNIETNLVNGILHNLEDLPLVVTAATPVPVFSNLSAFSFNDEGNIELVYSRALSPESVTNTPTSAYSLILDGVDVGIASVTMSPDSDLVVILTPATPIDNNFNTLVLNYEGNNIESVLGATSDLDGFAEPFSNIPVLAPAERIFEISNDFEAPNTVGGNNNFIYRARERQSGRSAEQAFSGFFSFRFANFPNGTDLSNALAEVTPVNYLPGRVRTRVDFMPRVPVTDVAATYRLEFALYIEDLPVVDATAPVEFEFRVQGQSGGGLLSLPRFDVVSNPPTLTVNTSLTDSDDPNTEVTTPLVKGSWQIVKVDIPGSLFVQTSPSPLYRYVFTTPERNNPNPFLFYLDDIRVYQLD